MDKIALITGITGQDGSYLADLLLKKGYQVHGTSRKAIGEVPQWRHSELGIQNNITIHTCTLLDPLNVTNLILSIKPTEIYHLAAESSVQTSWDTPAETLNANIFSTITLLEAIRNNAPSVKLFYASSSEIFDQYAPLPFSLATPTSPSSPYGVSKLAAHIFIKNYREKFGIFAVNGVLFPHESPLRQARSFIKQLIHHACSQTPYQIDSIKTERDFGDAREFVHAMWLSLQQYYARDYIIATGKTTSTESVIKFIFETLEAPPELALVKNTSNTTYPTSLYGDVTETITLLNWRPKQSFFTVIEDMIEFELRHNKEKFATEE